MITKLRLHLLMIGRESTVILRKEAVITDQKEL